MDLYFSDFFEVPASQIKRYGAFNISLVADLPLFIDPFLLFNSRKPEYKALHKGIIDYLLFLRDKSMTPSLDTGLVRALYRFQEVRQNWLGFSVSGNQGSGLGEKFARALHQNLHRIFGQFGDEQWSKGSHLEKLCLIEPGVGRDNISDFTTNLIKEYLLTYTETFTKQNIRKGLCKRFLVGRVQFNYETESWQDRSFVLPCFENDFVILTPKNMLTKEETWINREDLFSEFDLVRDAVPNDQLRGQINNYFLKVLPKKATAVQKKEAEMRTIRQFPQLIDAFIRVKEENGQEAVSISSGRVQFSEQLYLRQFGALAFMLEKHTAFYSVQGKTLQEARTRVGFLKDVIENKGGHKLFYVKGKQVQRETDIHILYRLTWFATGSDVSREVNDGRGPADFKISRGSKDKTLVEFKLASNSQLEKNLLHQTKIYQKASDAKKSLKVIVYFSIAEHGRVIAILKKLGLEKDDTIILIDARSDNKPSGSKAA
jgi:hypothetical protein